jgi:hypothetical protein
MKPEERVVQSDFQRVKLAETIVYEPDGNMPPDFLLSGSIAIEVRRLNENYKTEQGKAIGLEQDMIRLWNKLESACAQVAKQGAKQYFIEVQIVGERPLDLSWLTTKAITDLYSKATTDCFTHEELGIRLDWKPRLGVPRSEAVVVYIFMDDAAGGWTGIVYSENIQAVIDEKWVKCMQNARQPYGEWWLVLVDYIFPSTDFLSHYEFIPDLKGFSKVIVLDFHGTELHQYGASRTS